MTILDGSMGKLAKNLIDTFGAPATLSRKGAPLYDTETGDTETPEDSSIACTVVYEDFRAHEIDGTLIRFGDRKGLVSRLKIGYEPEPNLDTLTEGGKTWKIVRLIGYPSGAEEAAYSLHLRPGG